MNVLVCFGCGLLCGVVWSVFVVLVVWFVRACSCLCVLHVVIVRNCMGCLRRVFLLVLMRVSYVFVCVCVRGSV